MIDLITLVIILIVVVVVMLRRTSAGVAILALLAGLFLDQLLASWILQQLPQTDTYNQYVPIALRLIIGFAPVVIAIVAVKTPKQNLVLSLLTSLVLGFLIVFFGMQILEPVSVIAVEAKKSGLFSFVRPYQNEILAFGAILAIIEMAASHRSGITHGKKKRSKD